MNIQQSRFPILLQFILLCCISILFACAKTQDSAHGPLIDLGIDEAETMLRLDSSLVGQFPDGPGNPENICNNGEMQLMEDDPHCGYVDIGKYCVNQINQYRAIHGLPPFIRAVEYELCAAREARLALENETAHWSDGCGWKSQGAAGGGRGGDDSDGTVEKSVWWVPKLFYEEGSEGGHYQAMMTERSRGVACGYYALNRDKHAIVVNYYDEL
ncbi:MAG: hypothetical protein GY756_23720 [bacterium]|nr:hypothetical protein [bacterium]